MQCYAEKQSLALVPEEILATGVNPAVFEIAGHLVLKREEDYANLTQVRFGICLIAVQVS